MGLMSPKVSASPWSRNHLNESRWMAMRSGRARTSSRLAKEKRSRVAERGKITPQGAGDGSGTRSVKPGGAEGETRAGTATRQYTPQATRGQCPRNRAARRVSRNPPSVKGSAGAGTTPEMPGGALLVTAVTGQNAGNGSGVDGRPGP